MVVIFMCAHCCRLSQTISDFDGHWVNDVSVRDGEAPALFVGDARGVLSVYATKPNANANTASSSGAVALTFGGTGIQKPEAVVDDALTMAAQNFTLARPQQKAHELV